MKRIDLTGNVYGRLKVLGYAFSKNGTPYWNCICECGREKIALGKDLKRGMIRSCGCLRREIASKRQQTHGNSETRLYYIWLTMKNRCKAIKTKKAYKNYVMRGISVCSEWLDFSTFQEWAIKNGYNDNLTIDRINNDGDYCPENCRWSDMYTQANNKRTNVHLTFKNKTQTIAQWARELGMKYNTLDERLRKGWSVEDALTIPVHNKGRW